MSLDSVRMARWISAFRITRYRAFTETSSWSAPTRRREPAEESAIPEPSTLARVRSSGNSVQCPSRERSVTTPGKAIAGKAASASTPGRSTSPWTSSAAFSICLSLRRSAAITEATGRARTCSETQWSPSISRPARTSGTSRLSITICGTPTRLRLPDCSTSFVAGGRFRLWP